MTKLLLALVVALAFSVGAMAQENPAPVAPSTPGMEQAPPDVAKPADVKKEKKAKKAKKGKKSRKG